MPSLLSLPRELRDSIYREVLDGPLLHRHSRKRLTKRVQQASQAHGTESWHQSAHTQLPTIDSTLDAADAGLSATDGASTAASATQGDVNGGVEYQEGDEVIRYSQSEPLPPTTPLLRTNWLLHSEMLEAVNRTKIDYRIRLALRKDMSLIYPTWISVPALSNRINVLNVELSVRPGKTKSIFSSNSSADEPRHDEDVVFGAMVLLRRFLERGPFFIARKKPKDITVEKIVFDVNPKEVRNGVTNHNLFDQFADILDDYLTEMYFPFPLKSIERRDEFLRFFERRIKRFECRVCERSKEWVLADVVAEMDRRKQSSKATDEHGFWLGE